MKKNLSKIIALLLSLTLILTSAMAVFADTEDLSAAADEGTVQTTDDAEEQSVDVADSAEQTAGPQDTGALTAENEQSTGQASGQESGTGGLTSGTGDQGGTDPGTGTEPGGGDDPQPAAYTVIWMNGDQEIERDENVAEGTAPSFDGEAPTKSSDAEFNYTFSGWAEENGAEQGKTVQELPAVSGDVTYYAAFSKEAKQHEHTWGDWTVTVKPTCFKTGTKVRTCTSCGEKQTQTVAKLVAKNKWVKNTANGKWAYFGSNGKMYLSWHKMKMRNSKTVKWIYFSRGGAYVKSISKNTKNKWVKAGGYKFYFNKKKKPVGAGFNFIKGKLYHMDKYGAVMYGTFKASDGNTYKANSSGAISGLAYYRYKYKTFVLIDISEQTLWYYKGGTLKLKTDVVTGTKGKHNTPTGTFKVRSKQRNIYLNGSTWSSHVNYWMAFIGSSHGMHDANWRSSAQFSNHKTYIHNGSHGCVNMRPSAAKKLYGMISVGTKVIVQN